MAFVDPVGGISSDGLPMRPDEKIATGLADNNFDLLKGSRFRGPKGIVFILVESAGTYTTNSGACWKWTNTDEFIVRQTEAAGTEYAVGVSAENLPDLLAGDYFLIQAPDQEGAVIRMRSSAAISAGALVEPTTVGEIVTDASGTATETLGVALEAATGADELIAVGCYLDGFRGAWA